MYAKNTWEKYANCVNDVMEYNEGYKDYISKNKTERACVKDSIKLAEEKGFKPLESFDTLKSGDKVYVTNRGKNIALFIIGFCFLGKAFAMKTLISTFLFPILLEFFNQQSYLHGLLNDQLLICILGGFLLGLGIGLVLKAGGSTGGFDILALVVEKYFKVPVTLLVNGIDATILVLQISFHSVPEIVYGIMTILITAYMMNYLLSSGKGCVQVLVMSKEIERMKMMILNDMDAGVTLLDGKSGFYGNDTEVVLTILPYRKLPDLKDKIKEIDEKAFIIVSHVEEVSGNGFTYSKEMREASF